MYIRAIAIFILSMAIISCADDAEKYEAPQPDFITLAEGSALTASPEGGDVCIRFNCNKEWSVDIPNTSEHFYGVIQNRKGPAGENSLIYTTLPNTGMTSRSTTIRIISGRAEVIVTVNQEVMPITLTYEDEIRLYLKRLYESTDGDNWRFKGKWGSELPLNQWGSEVKYENGRLSLILGEHNLNGNIDLSGCTALVSLRCSKNMIGSIDVSGCPLLEELYCTNTGLERINLDGCHSLRYLYVSYNNLSDINIGWSKTLNRLDVRNCQLKELDLSQCVSLKNFACNNNRISRLEMPHRQNLIDVFCYENELKTLDVSDSPLLNILNCGDNEISELNVKGCPRLSWIYCYNNRLTSLDISDQKDVLSNFYCYSNRITQLDMSAHRLISELHCSDNGMTRLNVTGCRNLRWLYCSHNQLEELDFTGTTDVFERLDCSYNRLNKADIASLHLLRLRCQGNRIGGEIPEHFDRMLQFEYDKRYEYYPNTGTFTDRGYGWWYPGEPDKMNHIR